MKSVCVPVHSCGESDTETKRGQEKVKMKEIYE